MSDLDMPIDLHLTPLPVEHFWEGTSSGLSDIVVRNPARGRTGLCAWQYRKTLRFIENRLSQTIKVEDIATEVRMSAGHFSRAFAISFGIAPYAFLLNKRLERAQQLMLKPDQQLSAIAFECGLADQAHLSKLFRKLVGTTPARWRRERLVNQARTTARRTSGVSRLDGCCS